MLMPQSPDAVDALFCPNETILQPRAAPRVAPPQPKPRSGENQLFGKSTRSKLIFAMENIGFTNLF